MEVVDFRQSFFIDGSNNVKGSLGTLNAVDTSLSQNNHSTVMTVSESAQSLVQFEVDAYEPTSLRYPGYDWSVKLRINRPEIKLLLRFINDIGAYVVSFSPTRADLPTSGISSVKDVPVEVDAASKSLVRVEVDLDHPVLVLPRSSLSDERISIDLGSIKLTNWSEGCECDSRQWDIDLQNMKLEAISERGTRRAIVENSSAGARIVLAGNGPVEREAGLIVDVTFQEVCGKMTDAEYGLLLCVLSENFTESKAGLDDGAILAKEAEAEADLGILIDKLNDRLRTCRSRGSGRPLSSLYRFTINRANVEISVGKDLDAEVESDLVRIMATSVAVRYELIDGPVGDAEADGDGLLWRCGVTFRELEVSDSRPAMSARVLPFLSTENRTGRYDDQEGVDCFTLDLSKTMHFHTGISIEIRQVEAVADAGLFMMLLGWLGAGSAAASKMRARVGELQYQLVRPGGLLVSTRLPRAHVHLVTDFETFDSDSFVVQGCMELAYAQIRHDCLFTADLAGVSVDSHRFVGVQASVACVDSDEFRDPAWVDCDVMRPCDVGVSYSWCAAALRPAAFGVRATDVGLDLKHADILMGQVVAEKLAESLALAQSPAPAEARPESDAGRATLTFDMALSAMKVRLMSSEDDAAVMEAEMHTVAYAGRRGEGGALASTGTLGDLSVRDLSCRQSLHPDVVTVPESAGALVEFGVSTHPRGSPGYPGHDTAVRVRVNRPQIKLLLRFINEVSSYAASFSPAGRLDGSTALPPGPAGRAEERGAGRGPPALVRLEVELDHPVLILPESSVSEGRLSMDLGRIRLTNALEGAACDGRGWDIDLQSMKLESVSASGTRQALVEDLHASARVTLAGPAPAGPCDAGLTVDVALGRVCGQITDAQYGLLLCVLAQNFTEARSGDSVLAASGFCPAAPEEDMAVLIDRMNNRLRVCEDAARGRPLAALYRVTIPEADLALSLAPGLDAAPTAVIARLVASGVAVRYELLQSPTGDIDAEGDGLCWRCRVGFRELDLLDSRPGTSARAQPALSTKERGMRGEGEEAYTDCFVLDFAKTLEFHTGISVELRQAVVVADAGLLMTLLGWLGRGAAATAGMPGEVGELRYQLVRPGGLIVRVGLPASRIHLVKSFAALCPDQFVAESTVKCRFAARGAQSSLRVDLMDFTVTSHSNARPESNANMRIVRPSLLSLNYHWASEPPPGGDAGGGAAAAAEAAAAEAYYEVFASASDFNAMLTYEDAFLLLDVAAMNPKNKRVA